jgi:hypothetical protein
MPMPVSRTSIITSPRITVAVRSTWPPWSVYLAALVSRFDTICVIRTGSPSIVASTGGSVTVRRCCLRSRSGRAASTAASTAPVRATCVLFSVNLPCVMRATSNRSSSNQAMCDT